MRGHVKDEDVNKDYNYSNDDNSNNYNNNNDEDDDEDDDDDDKHTIYLIKIVNSIKITIRGNWAEDIYIL